MELQQVLQEMNLSKLPDAVDYSDERCIALAKRGERNQDFVIANKGKVVCDRGYRMPVLSLIEFYPFIEKDTTEADRLAKEEADRLEFEAKKAEAIQAATNAEPPKPPKDVITESLNEIKSQESCASSNPESPRPVTYQEKMQYIKDNNLFGEGESGNLKGQRVQEILDTHFNK